MKKIAKNRKVKSKVSISSLGKSAKNSRKPRGKTEVHASLKIPVAIGVAAVVAGSYLLFRKK